MLFKKYKIKYKNVWIRYKPKNFDVCLKCKNLQEFDINSCDDVIACININKFCFGSSYRYITHKIKKID